VRGRVIVVSDTTPINVLVRLGFEELLRDAYGRVYLPLTVLDELLHENTPIVVRAWAQDLPGWVIVRAPKYPVPSILNVLDDGERDALALALELGADVVLVDDLQARNTALRMGLRIAGTLGILGVAAELGKLDFDVVVRHLLAIGFRASARNIELARPKLR